MWLSLKNLLYYDSVLISIWLYFSSRYFHWKLNLCVILLILVFMVPFYIGYFVVSNIRLCEYLVYGSGAANLRLCIRMRNTLSERERGVDHYPCSSLLPLALFWLDNFSLELQHELFIEQLGDALPDPNKCRFSSWVSTKLWTLE